MTKQGLQKHASLAASEDFKSNRGEKWGYQIVSYKAKKKDVDLPFATDRKIGKFTVGGVFFSSFFLLHIFQKLIKSSIYSQIWLDFCVVFLFS